MVDWKNTSGFGTGEESPIVLIYTAAGNPAVQCLAYSTDKGCTFTKYTGNPVVRSISPGNRDPKVLWHGPTQRWVMLYVGLSDESHKDAQGRPATKHTIHFLTLPNLKDWTVASQAEGFYECPDFFELPVDGDALNKKWVLTAASSEYMIGTFDGKRLTPETPKLLGHRGRGFYAAQTFSDIPAADGRRVQIGWLQAPTPGMPFNQYMSVPLELTLRSTPEGPRLAWQPVKELETLRTKSYVFDPLALKPGDKSPFASVRGELLDIRAEFVPGEATEIVFTVRDTPVRYDAQKQELAILDHRAPAPLRDGKQRLIILADRTCIEVFASDGLTYVPFPTIPRADDQSVDVSAKGAAAQMISMEVHELGSIWTTPHQSVARSRTPARSSTLTIIPAQPAGGYGMTEGRKPQRIKPNNEHS